MVPSMRSLWGAVQCCFFIAAGWATLVPTAASTQELLRCTAVDAIRVLSDGRLGTDRVSDMDRSIWSKFTVDTASGVVRRLWASGPEFWHIIQEGDKANDFIVAMNTIVGPSNNDFLRIRVWTRPITFWVIAMDVFVTGTCEPIK